MSGLTLYRGIVVSLAKREEVIASIRSGGLSGDEGRQFFVPDVRKVRNLLEVLFARPGLAREDIFDDTPFPGIFACGDLVGAEYYGARASEGDQPLVVEFDAPVDEVYVDSRDF